MMSNDDARGLASWAYRGLPPWILLVGFPLWFSLLIAPVADDTPGPNSWSAWAAAGAAAATFAGAVLTRLYLGPKRRPLAIGLLGALAALAVVTTAAYSSAWASLFALLAIAVGVVLGSRQAPYVVLLVTVAATTTVLLSGGSADDAFPTGVTVLLSGLGTYAFCQLFSVIAELKCTRQELARLAVSAERDRFSRDLLGHTLSTSKPRPRSAR